MQDVPGREPLPTKRVASEESMERHEDLLLPEDVLADVLRRLPQRSLAAFRCVSKLWRHIIDDHRLLRLELPHSLGSIIINLHGLKSSQFLCHPSTAPTISTNLDYTTSRKLDYLYNLSIYVKDHCNGLLLVHDKDDWVVNPATRQLARLPQCPYPAMGRRFFYTNNYIVFDPVVSSHYEVFSIPRVLNVTVPRHRLKGMGFDPAIEALEWPPSPCILHVFSSRTRRWEEKSFVREGEAMGTVAAMRADSYPHKRYAVYWQGELYVQCENNFIMRISLSDRKYCIIKPTIGMDSAKYPNIYLGRSENGVYCAVTKMFELWIWYLRDSNCQMEWVLKHYNDLTSVLPPQYYHKRSNESWALHHVNSYEGDKDDAMWDEDMVERDPDSLVMVNHEHRNYYSYYVTLLGFHPYKEVLFLGETFRTGLAYHLNNFKVQNLGNLCPPCYEDATDVPFIEASFQYTPCFIRMLLETIDLETDVD